MSTATAVYKRSEQLGQELEQLKADYERGWEALLSETNNPTPEQRQPLRELRDRIRCLEYEVVRERRREIEVGDGCTLILWTDKEAYTVIRKTKTMIVMQRDKAIKDSTFKPEWVPGGFSAICTNQEEQSYTYEADPNGSVIKAYWSEVKGCYVHDGCKVINGRHEFYDYNF